MRSGTLLIFLLAFICPVDVSAQLDSLKESDRSKIGVVDYFRLLKTDFSGQISSPLKLPGHLPEVAGFAVFTFGLMRSDRAINDYSIRLTARNRSLEQVSSRVTRFGGRYALFTMAALGATGFVTKDRKLLNTSLIASHAYLTSGIWVAALKFVSGRERPSYVSAPGVGSTGAWHGPFYQYKKDAIGSKPDGASFSSFCSGHAAAAFSIATTFAEMYREKPAVVIIAYSSASLVALSRITEHKHWASDVFVASALGYLSGKQAARNFRKLQASKTSGSSSQNNIEFGVDYNFGVLMPSLTWRF